MSAKVLVQFGRASTGAGPIKLPDAAVGDQVLAVIAQRGGDFKNIPPGAFEDTISVEGEIQQLLDGQETDPSRHVDPYGNWGYYQFAFILQSP